jgi:hypothetical protein
LLEEFVKLNPNPIAMKRRGAAENDTVVVELDGEWMDPRDVCEVRNLFLEAAQHFVPDLGFTDHSIQPGMR